MFPSLVLIVCVFVLLAPVAFSSPPGHHHVGTGRKVWKRFQRLLHNEHDVEAGTNATTHMFNNAIVDHFDSDLSGSVERWSQRFYVDETFWNGDGPVFLYIGGEGPQGPPSSGLFMYELAKEHSALMVALEHRYYGESRPVQNMSLENLRYLTSQQALADLAFFREYIASVVPSQGGDTLSSPPLQLSHAIGRDAKFITFGGSYPGALAAWFKLKYPSLTVGSVASSAPVHAEVNFEQYGQVVGFALSYELVGGSSACYDAVANATAELRSLVVGTTPYGVSKSIPKALEPCSPIKSELDLAMYEADVFGNFQGVVQYNTQMPVTVSDICQGMLNSSGSALENLASVTEKISGGECVQSSFEKDMIAPLSNETFSSPDCNLDCQSMRQWIYQSCHEFGFFQTTTAANANPFSAFKANTIVAAGSEVCKQAYGVKQSVSSSWSNAFYGDRNLPAINLTIPNGSIDPWHSLGIVNDTNTFYESCTDLSDCAPQKVSSSGKIVFIDGTAHCRDMSASRSTDPEPIVWAHAAIRADIEKYLS